MLTEAMFGPEDSFLAVLVASIILSALDSASSLSPASRNVGK
jgi:hypothetical protein